MPRHIRLEPHLTVDELHGRYRRVTDLVKRSRWHFLWLLAQGVTATAIASVTGYSAYWLDRAGWHTRARLRVPEHVHLLFLPPYPPRTPAG